MSPERSSCHRKGIGLLCLVGRAEPHLQRFSRPSAGID
jgi:hypothetical protein